MIIVISLHYYVNGVKSLRQGEFRVNMRDYKKDPKQEAARIAYEWWRKLKREYIYTPVFYKALYNGNDITKELEIMAKIQPGG